MINNSLTNEQMKTDEIFESIFNRSLTTVANNKKNANTEQSVLAFFSKIYSTWPIPIVPKPFPNPSLPKQVQIYDRCIFLVLDRILVCYKN